MNGFSGKVLQILDSASDLSDNLETVLEVMAEHTGMMRGVITLLDEAHGEIAIEAAYGMSAEAQSKGRYKLGEGITGKVIESGKPLVIPKVLVEPLFLNRTGSRSRKEAVSFICVPVKMEGRVIGALSADRLFAASEALEEDMRLLSVLASLISKAVKNRQERHRMLEENRRLLDVLRERSRPEMFVGRSPGLRAVLTQLAQVAPTSATVLLLGESGTGKELAANTIHAGSPRAGHPFIKINCAALPEGLIESELFGHEKGAFTGAVGMRKGRFEAADGGTLFLDEIGELAVSTQVKLLRVLQSGEIQRVGGLRTVPVDLRIISATNKDLKQAIAQHQFRADLYYRISTLSILVPPLRERAEDILPLAEHFIHRHELRLNRHPVPLPQETAEAILRYPWPGNIRQLESAVERAVHLAEGGALLPEHFGIADLMENRRPAAPAPAQATLEDIERQAIAAALVRFGGNISQTAFALGVSRPTLYRKMSKYGLEE
mgnify:CR=1 FL=1